MASATASLHVASYNVHRCVGTDGRHDPDRIVEVIAQIGADVIALQEVDAGYHHEGGIDQIEYLQRMTGCECVEGITLRTHIGRYGNAVLSRCAVQRAERFDLSVAKREPRGAIDLTVGFEGKPVRLVMSHFGLLRQERIRQARRLVEIIGTHDGRPLVVLGDFNEWSARGGALRVLQAALGSAPAPRTFPSWRPLLRLDRIWVKPAFALEAVQVHATPLARVASDHLPISARITPHSDRRRS